MVVSVLFHILSELIFYPSLLPPFGQKTGRFAEYCQNKESAKNRWSRCFSPLHLFLTFKSPLPQASQLKKVWKIRDRAACRRLRAGVRAEFLSMVVPDAFVC